jgi:WD40 repeat protein
MSPEQANGEPLDVRSDLFSFGCVLYQLCTGETAFKGDKPMKILRAVATEQPVAPRKINPDIPAKLAQLIMGLLAKDPSHRPPSAREVADRLATIERDLGKPTQRNTGRWKWALAAAALIGIVVPVSVAFGPTIIRFANNQGQVIIESDKDVRVIFKQGDNRVEVIDTKTNRQFEIKIMPAGTYEMEIVELLDGGAEGFRTRTKHFTLKRGGEVVIKAWVQLTQAREERAKWWDGLRREDIPPYELKAARVGNPPTTPPGVVGILGDSRFCHWGTILALAISPDGKRIATGSVDQTCRVWDSHTGEQLALVQESRGAVGAIAYSPDGKLLASTDSYGVYIREAPTGKALFVFKHDVGDVTCMAFSPDSKRLAAASVKRGVKIWNATKQEGPLSIPHDALVMSVAFTPDGKVLACGSVVSGSLSSPGDAREITFWNADTGQQDPDYKGRMGLGWSVAINKDGLVAAGDHEGRIVAWDPRIDKIAFTVVKAHNGGVKALAFSSDSKSLASAGFDGLVKVWETAGGRELSTTSPAVPIKRRYCVGISPDDQRLFTCGEGARVRVFETLTGKDLFPQPAYLGTVSNVSIAPDGRTLASGHGDGDIRLWDLSGQSVRLRRNLTGPGSNVRHLNFSPDGNLLAAAFDDHTIKIWNLPSQKLWRTLKGHGADVYQVRFSNNAKRLASASPGDAPIVWDVATAKPIFKFKGHRIGPETIDFSPDGTKVASGAPDGQILTWDSETGETLLPERVHSGLNRLAFSPDGKRLVSASRPGTIKVWGTATGQELFSDRHGDYVVTCARFSPNGMSIGTSGLNGLFKIWDVASGKNVHTLRLAPRGCQISWFDFSPDGRHLVTANSNGTIYMIRLPDEKAAN